MKMNHVWTRKQLLCLSFFILCPLLLCGCSERSVDERQELSGEEPAWPVYANEPVKLKWYINYNWYTTPWGHNLVSKAITDETGVDVEFVVPTGNETEKLNSMIASDTLPDLITLGWWESQVQEMVEKDMVYALNELAEEYDPYFFQVAKEQTVDWYTQEDGKLYCYPNSSTTPQDCESDNQIEGNLNFLVRKDIYEAIGSPDMTTKEGFVAAVQKAAELFPEVGGEPLIPIGSDEFREAGCNSFDKYLLNFLNIPHEKEGTYYDRYTDPEYISWLKVFRELNEMGYLSEEIFLDKRIQLEEKLANGRYFCLLYQGSDIHAPQKELYAKDPDRIYIAVDGPKNSAGDDPIVGSTAISGWTVTMISKKCENPERAIAFMTYFLSEHGQKRIFLGVEGETYDVIEGEYVVKPEVQELINTNRAEYDALYGADDAYWMLQDNVMQDSWGLEEAEAIKQLKEWTRPYVQYTGQYDVVFDKETEIGNCYERVQAEWGKVLPKLLLAASEDEFDLIFERFIEEREEWGYEAVLEACTNQMIESKRKLGIE